jgi:hypothetical protein
MATNPPTHDGARRQSWGRREKERKKMGRNVRVVRSSTSRIVDITETKDRAKDEHDRWFWREGEGRNDRG